MSDIITVKNLVEIYSDGTKAVDDISFTVKEREFFGFLGPNGAGKSTTIKILTTLLRKTSGSVTIAGYDLDTNATEIRKIIGVQSQETTVDGDLTGRENIILQGHFQQMESSKLKKRVNELLQLVGLESSCLRVVAMHLQALSSSLSSHSLKHVGFRSPKLKLSLFHVCLLKGKRARPHQSAWLTV
jgi:ABC-2 type transport system ATP-binding protein